MMFCAPQAQASARSAIAAVTLCSIALPGCVHYTPRPLVPEQTAAKLESRALSDAGLRAYMEQSLGHPLDQWPMKSWNLELLTLAAFYYHPALDVARAQWNVSRAAVQTAGARPNPTLTATPGYSSNPPVAISHWLPSVGLDVPIETAGKRGHRLGEARQLSEAARLNVMTAAWDVRRNLRTALLVYATAQKRAVLLNDQVALQEEIIRRLDQRHVAGAIAGNEVILARTQAGRTRLELQNLRSQVADARVRVADALGAPARILDSVELTAELDPASATAVSSGEARQRALQSRSDILSALAEYAAAQSALQLEIAKQYPDVHLGPGFQWDQGEKKWQLGLTIELPVLNHNQGPIAEAEARRGELAARFIALQAKVASEVDHASSGLQVAEEFSRTGEALMASELQQLHAIQAQLKAGAADALDVAGAQLEYVAAEALAEDARARHAQVLADLEDAVQRPLGSEERVRALRHQIESTQETPRRQDTP